MIVKSVRTPTTFISLSEIFHPFFTPENIKCQIWKKSVLDDIPLPLSLSLRFLCGQYGVLVGMPPRYFPRNKRFPGIQTNERRQRWYPCMPLSLSLQYGAIERDHKDPWMNVGKIFGTSAGIPPDSSSLPQVHAPKYDPLTGDFGSFTICSFVPATLCCNTLTCQWSSWSHKLKMKWPGDRLVRYWMSFIFMFLKCCCV